ncbi:hypothetical protein BC830DRAFT_1124540 [Chytriomyces sp. MP71]|nr:hypothetical protein BC830DRAFT_1124540 [Chytriomyces sp. MP71]
MRQSRRQPCRARMRGCTRPWPWCCCRRRAKLRGRAVCAWRGPQRSSVRAEPTEQASTVSVSPRTNPFNSPMAMSSFSQSPPCPTTMTPASVFRSLSVLHSTRPASLPISASYTTSISVRVPAFVALNAQDSHNTTVSAPPHLPSHQPIRGSPSNQLAKRKASHLVENVEKHPDFSPSTNTKSLKRVRFNANASLNDASSSVPAAHVNSDTQIRHEPNTQCSSSSSMDASLNINTQFMITQNTSLPHPSSAQASGSLHSRTKSDVHGSSVTAISAPPRHSILVESDSEDDDFLQNMTFEDSANASLLPAANPSADLSPTPSPHMQPALLIIPPGGIVGAAESRKASANSSRVVPPPKPTPSKAAWFNALLASMSQIEDVDSSMFGIDPNQGHVSEETPREQPPAQTTTNQPIPSCAAVSSITGDDSIEQECRAASYVQQKADREAQLQAAHHAGASLFSSKILDQLTCSICMECMVAPHVLGPCSHSFCAPCIALWLRGKATCPQCRVAVDRARDVKPNALVASIVETLVPFLGEEEVAARREREAAWQMQRAEEREEEARREREGREAAATRSGRGAAQRQRGSLMQMMRQQQLMMLQVQRMQRRGAMVGRQQPPINQYFQQFQQQQHLVPPQPSPVPVQPFVDAPDYDLIGAPNVDRGRRPHQRNPETPATVAARELDQPILLSGSDDEDDGEDLEPEPVHEETSYNVEPARSGRSTCRTCRHLIPHRAMRFCVQERGGHYGYDSTLYHHIGCLAPFLPDTVKREPERLISGFTMLEDSDKAAIRQNNLITQ